MNIKVCGHLRAECGFILLVGTRAQFHATHKKMRSWKRKAKAKIYCRTAKCAAEQSTAQGNCLYTSCLHLLSTQ